MGSIASDTVEYFHAVAYKMLMDTSYVFKFAFYFGTE